MPSPNYSFTGHTGEIINKISQAIKEVDTSVPASLYNHRRYLYLVQRLAIEMEDQIYSWKDLESHADSSSFLFAAVNRELSLPPEHYEGHNDHEGRTTPQQRGARFADFPNMLPAPPFMQTARILGFATPPQYTAIPSSPPTSAARPDHRVTTEDEEERADAFPTQDAQKIQMEARDEGRDAYLGSSQNTTVDYPSSQPKEEDG